MVLIKFRFPSLASRKQQAGPAPEPFAPCELGVAIIVPKESTMSSTPPATAPAPLLSLLVLLPASAHMQQQPTPIAPPSRPTPLTSRQSGSTVPSMKQLSEARRSDEQEREIRSDDAEIDQVVSAGRRLSLAPGLGASTQTRFTKGLAPLTDTPSPTPNLAGSSREAPAAFGARPPAEQSTPPPAFGAPRSSGSGPRGPTSRRRPQTAATSALPINQALMGGVSRGSIALPRGNGLGFGGGGGGFGRSRPGWEGDELVGVLRNSGLEATVIRNVSHLPSIISPHSSSPIYPSFNQPALSARPSTPTVLTHVILVPLCDSPSLPSLSLLLAQGTTPTAVCFQQDLLERAKRTEDEWLPFAVEQIRTVSHMRDRAVSADQQGKVREAVDSPIILAYSADPRLSSSTITACIQAGASGVLRPPYNLDTSKLVRRMVRAAREGRISSVVGMPSQGHNRSMSREEDEMDTTVILPPTALQMGGEQEGDQVLSAAVRSHQRGLSGQWYDRGASPSARPRENSTPTRMLTASPSRKRSPGAIPLAPPPATPPSTQTTTTPVTAKSNARSPSSERDHYRLVSLYRYDPSCQTRRRSVETGGLGPALRRAQRAFEVAAAPTPIKGLARANVDSGFTFPATPTKSNREASAAEEEQRKDTQMAELLGAMYYQTMRAIQIQMADYSQSSAPLSREYRTTLIDALATWDFRPHDLGDGDLFRIACILFEGILGTEGLVELNINTDQVNRLLFAIRAIYHAPNPYHNYVHAIDVLQATYTFLIGIGVAPPFDYLRSWTPGSEPWIRPDETEKPVCGLGTRRAREILRPQDVLAILVAAMGHDVGHPGLSNAFMKNARTPLSQVYDDKSVLENMHCMLIVQLLRKHGFGFLLAPIRSPSSTQNPARAALDTKGFRKVLYSSVLATDMSLHFAWIQNLKEFGAKIATSEGKMRVTLEEAESDRITLCQSLIKSADISNPTRPIDVSEHWSTVLLKEWAVQASLEQDLDLPVSVIASADAALQAKGQIGFIDLFTQPLFEAVSDVIPELQCYADWCSENRSLWQQRLDHLTETIDAIHLVQPVVESAAHDKRFRTLFPLSLPASLVGTTGLNPGPAVSPVTPPPRKAQAASPDTATHPTSYETAESPAAKAMRAVYHANLLGQRHRLTSGSRGTVIPGIIPLDYNEGRRMSTPDAVLSSGMVI